MRPVGIDFGTTNSLVAAFSSGAPDALVIDTPPEEWGTLGYSRVLPSVFAIGQNEEPLFGWAAKTARGGKAEAVKRLFAEEEVIDVSGRSFLVEEIAALLFAQLKKAAAGAGVDFSKAVVTVPSNSRGLARYRTKLCAGMAGIDVVALLNEPTAAAMAHGLRSMGDQTMLVVDWGGGTLDATVLQSIDGVFFEQASRGVPKLGGIDFDSALARAISETVPGFARWSEAERNSFRLDVELAKVRLSTQEETNVPLPNGDYHRVTRQLFEGAIQPLLDKAREPIERCLEDVSRMGGDIDTAILVGGTCSTPAVRELVKNLVDSDIASGVDPLTAIAEGAAIAAAILSGELETNDFYVATEHALGTATLDPNKRALEFSELIPRNHKLPARETDTYTPIADFQPSVRVTVIEGDPSLPIDHELNVQLKEWEIEIPDPGPASERSFDMTYEYDTDGILHVTLVDNSTGKELLRDDVSFDLSRDSRELVQMAKRVNTTVESGTVSHEERAELKAHDPETAMLLQRARTKVIPFLDDEEADQLRGLVRAVEEATEEQLESAKSTLEEELKKYMYLF